MLVARRNADTFVYGLILSAFNGLPIQRTHQPVRNSNWLRNVPPDHATRILRTDDVFLIQPYKDPEPPLDSPTAYQHRQDARIQPVSSSPQINPSPSDRVTHSNISISRRSDGNNDTSNSSRGWASVQPVPSDHNHRVTRSENSNDMTTGRTNVTSNSSGGWGSPQVAKSSGGWGSSAVANKSSGWVTSTDGSSTQRPSRDNEESKKDKAVDPIAALPSVAAGKVAIGTTANNEVTSPDDDPHYNEDMNDALTQSLARAQIQMNKDLDARFGPNSNQKWCDIVKRHFIFSMNKELLSSFPEEYQTNQTPYLLNTPGYLKRLKNAALQFKLQANEKNNQAYVAHEKGQRKDYDEEDDFDSDDAMYDATRVPGPGGNLYVDPIILTVNQAFHILYILSQYTFFDLGLQYESLTRLPRDVTCNKCPFCPEFQTTLKEYEIDNMIQRQLNHEHTGQKKRKSAYQCRSQQFNNSTFFSHFESKKQSCAMHLLIWIYLNEMYPRKPSARKR